MTPIFSPQYADRFGYGGSASIVVPEAYSANGKRVLLRGTENQPSANYLTGQNSDLSEEMYLYDVPTEAYTQITHSFGADFVQQESVLSPDGNRAAFFSNGNLAGQNPKGEWQLFVYDAPTATLVQASTTTDKDRVYTLKTPLFSADGNRLLFMGLRSGYRGVLIHHYDRLTGTLTTINDRPGAKRFKWLTTFPDPRLSADGTRVFFRGDIDSEAAIWVYDVPADSFSKASSVFDYAWGFALNPNGAISMAFANKLYTYNPATKTLTSGTTSTTYSGWTFPTVVRPPGTPVTNIPEKDAPRGHLMVDNFHASADGSRFAAMSNPPGGSSATEIFVYDTPTATLRQITSTRAGVGPPLEGKRLTLRGMSADGNWVVFTGVQGRGSRDPMDIFLYDVSSATLSALPVGTRQVRQGGLAVAPAADIMFFTLAEENPDGVGHLNSLYRATCSSSPLTLPPAAPAAPAVREEDEQLTLTWSAPANNGSAVQRYTVQWKESSFRTFWEGVQVNRANLPASGTSMTHTITGLTNDTTYQVRVRATNAGGRGEWSRHASGTPREQDDQDQMPRFGDGTYEATLTVGKSVTLTLPAASGGDGALRYSLAPLPAGLSFNGQTRVLSGTPTTAQAATAATYTVTDSDDSDPDSDTRPFTLTILAADAARPGVLENPPAGSPQSGIATIHGWVCEADTVEIMVEHGTTGTATTFEAAYGTERSDTQEACGDTDNAFQLLFNWNLLGGGQHMVRVLVDGVELARQSVTVPEVGAEVLQGRDERYSLADFPAAGEAVEIQWSPAQQSFVLVAGSGGGQGAQHTPGEAILDSPQPASFQSGVGLIYGWVCEAEVVEIVVENGTTGTATTVEAAYGTERADTQEACGDTDNAFTLLFNWTLLGDGQHTVRAVADGTEFARSTFTVTTLGEAYGEFARGLSGSYVLSDFPAVGASTTVEWQEARQNFGLVGVTRP